MKVSLDQQLLVKDALQSKEQLCLVWYIFSNKVYSSLSFHSTSCVISFCLCYLAPMIGAE